MIESNLNNIKRDLMAEIHEIKEQLKHSVDMQLKINDQVSTSQKEIPTRSFSAQNTQENSSAPIPQAHSHGKNYSYCWG